MARRAKKASAATPEATPDVVETCGLVHPMGPGGGRLGAETTWTLRFSFALWRHPDGSLDERRLFLERPGLNDADLRVLMGAVNADEVIRVRLRWPLEQTQRQQTLRLHTEVVELLGPDTSDAELLARAEQMRQPVVLEHRRLGTLTLDRAMNSYRADPTWNRRRIQLHLERDGHTDEASLIALAETLWQDQPEWERRVRDCAVEKLLPLKNGNWLGEREKEFTPDRFKKRMKLESISLKPDGSFTFAYQDGNLFWGHWIVVEGTLTDGPTDADIAG